MLQVLPRGPATRVLRRAMRAAAIVVLTAVAAMQSVGLLHSLDPPAAYAKDFSQEYLLARALWDGTDTNLPIRVLAERYATVAGYFDKDNPTPHPPTAGLLALPLALLPYLSAVRVWLAVQVACLVLGVGLLVRANALPTQPLAVLAASFLLLGWAPMALELGLGQLTLPLLACLSGALLALARRRPRLGGLLLGLSLLLKPLAWPWLLVLVRRRDWAALGLAAGTLALGYALVALREGPGRVATYLLEVGPSLNATFLSEPTNLSLWTLGPRLLQGPSIAASAVSTVAVGLLLVLVWRWSAPHAPLGRSLGLATAASIVANPVSWEFYLVLALLPAAVAGGALRVHRDGRLAASLGLAALAPYVAVWGHAALVAVVAPGGVLPTRGGVLFGPAAAMAGYALGVLPALAVVWLSLVSLRAPASQRPVA